MINIKTSFGPHVDHPSGCTGMGVYALWDARPRVIAYAKAPATIADFYIDISPF